HARSRAVLSALAEASVLPSAEKARAMIWPWCSLSNRGPAGPRSLLGGLASMLGGEAGEEGGESGGLFASLPLVFAASGGFPAADPAGSCFPHPHKDSRRTT